MSAWRLIGQQPRGEVVMRERQVRTDWDRLGRVDHPCRALLERQTLKHGLEPIPNTERNAKQAFRRLVRCIGVVRETTEIAAASAFPVRSLDNLIQSPVFMQPLQDGRFQRRLTMPCEHERVLPC